MEGLTTSTLLLLLALSFVNAKANDVPRQNEDIIANYSLDEDDTLRYSIVDGVELRRFARIVEPFIPISYNINNKQSVPIVPLVVYILGNPDCYQAEPVKCNNK